MAAVATGKMLSDFQFSNTGIPTRNLSFYVRELRNRKPLVDIGCQVTGNDRMGAKIKTPKNPSASNKTPQKSLDQKLTAPPPPPAP